MAAITSTALAIGGIASSALGSAGSFIQAGKQRRLQREAQAAAEKAIQEARKALDVNYYEGLSIQKEPYELQREALLSQGAQAIQAGVEGEERGAAATAGRIQMAQNEAQAGVRTAMGKEMSDLEKLTAQEESRLRDVGVQLSMEEAAGAQQAAADAQRAAAQATQAGIQGIQSMGQQALQMAPLYGKAKTPAPAQLSGAQIAASSTPNTSGVMQTTKLAPFRNIPLLDMYGTYMMQDAKYGQGSKLGSPIKMPTTEDMFNYFNYFSPNK
jgi:hypothetical protein